MSLQDLIIAALGGGGEREAVRSDTQQGRLQDMRKREGRRVQASRDKNAAKRKTNPTPRGGWPGGGKTRMGEDKILEAATTLAGAGDTRALRGFLAGQTDLIGAGGGMQYLRDAGRRDQIKAALSFKGSPLAKRGVNNDFVAQKRSGGGLGGGGGFSGNHVPDRRDEFRDDRRDDRLFEEGLAQKAQERKFQMIQQLLGGLPKKRTSTTQKLTPVAGAYIPRTVKSTEDIDYTSLLRGLF